MEPGRTTPLTPEDFEQVVVSASIKDEQDANWQDKDGKVHRDGDLPAAIYSNGTMTWFEHGEKTGDQDNPPPGAIFPGQQTKSARKK